MTEEQAVPCPNCGKPILTEKFCPGCGTANPINYIDESVRVSKTRTVHRNERRHIPIRVIIVGIVVAASVLMASFFANSYALDNMQYRLIDVSDFDYATLTSKVKVEACNPSAFPAGFDNFNAVVHYQQKEFGRLSVEGGSVMPYQSSAFDGQLKLSGDVVKGLIIALADAVGGKDSPYNENDIILTMTVDSRILGIWPYSQSREFSFAEFHQFMSTQQADRYLCE